MEIDKLVDAVTKVIMEKLQQEDGGNAMPKVVLYGDVPVDMVKTGCDICRGTVPADAAGCDYIMMSASSFRALHGIEAPADVAQETAPKAECAPEQAAACECCGGNTVDLTGKRLIHERDLRDSNAQRDDIIKVDKKAIITALAYDYAKGIGAKFSKE